MSNTEIMRRYRDPAYQGSVADFCGKYAAVSGGHLAKASGDNPFCGDTLSIAVWLTGEEGEVADICYEGYGCSLCIASAEVLMETVMGREKKESLALGTEEILAGLSVGSVGRSRLKCVELPLDVFQRAILSGCADSSK